MVSFSLAPFSSPRRVWTIVCNSLISSLVSSSVAGADGARATLRWQFLLAGPTGGRFALTMVTSAGAFIAALLAVTLVTPGTLSGAASWDRSCKMRVINSSSPSESSSCRPMAAS